MLVRYSVRSGPGPDHSAAAMSPWRRCGPVYHKRAKTQVARITGCAAHPDPDTELFLRSKIGTSVIIRQQPAGRSQMAQNQYTAVGSCRIWRSTASHYGHLIIAQKFFFVAWQEEF
jgi:hypothetical protein